MKENGLNDYPSSIFVSNDNWHLGVLGIVASRLKDKFHRPSFVISSNLTPEIISPKGDSESIYPYFSWSKIQNANSYHIIISYDEDFSNIIYDNTNVTDNTFQYPSDAPILEYNTEYFWKVVAISEQDLELGDYSIPTKFLTPSGIIKMEFIFNSND